MRLTLHANSEGKWKVHRFPAVAMGICNFINKLVHFDIALVSNLEDQAQELLHRVEGACGDVGLRFNVKKTEVMTFSTDQVELKTLYGSTLAVT